MAQCQVLVVGGGPGGSTAATLLARQGIQVTLAERTVMPRYHIGESLLPSCLRIFDLLGVREKIDGYGFVRKEGGYFDWGGSQWPLEFGKLATPSYGFQVIRSEFDKLLLDHSRGQGVDVREGVEVREIRFDGKRPAAAVLQDSRGARSELSFDTMVDASGRAGLLSNRYLKNRRFHQAFLNVAVWGYWRNAKLLPVGPVGAIASAAIPHGWIWAIPLHDGTLSVGVVMDRDSFQQLRAAGTVDALYSESIGQAPLIADLVKGAELVPGLKTETDYSYTAETFAGPGYYLAGDAACFIDPLLSTGVHMAMFAGLLAAASIGSTVRGEFEAEEAAAFYSDSVRRAFLRLLVLVGGLYQMHGAHEDSNFRRAQSLTVTDYGNTELIQAFLHIVTGVEDLRDAESVTPERVVNVIGRLYQDHHEFMRKRDDWRFLPSSELRQGMDRMRVLNAVQDDFSLTPQAAVNGIHVVTEPCIGLTRSRQSPAEIHGA